MPDFARTDGYWPPELVFGANDAQRWDVAQMRALHDGGGVWNPLKPVVIGGAGLQCTTAVPVISGGVKTRLGGRIILRADMPAVSPARTSTRLVPLLQARQAPATSQLLDVVTGAQPWLGVVTTGTALQIPIPGRYLHNGATITSTKLNWRFLQRKSSVPAANSLMNARIVALTAVAGAGPAGTLAVTTTWTGAHVYALHAYVTPTVNNGFYYKATAIAGAHTSAGGEPTWPTTIGATVVDNPGANQITWTCIGHYIAMAPPANVDAYYAQGGPQVLEYDDDVGMSCDTTANKYVLVLDHVDSNVELLSLQIAFGGITSLAFE